MVKMKKSIFCIFLLIYAGVLIIGIIGQKRELNIETFDIDAQTEQEIKDEIIIAEFIQDIEKAVKCYYTKNLFKNVTGYDYETTILEVKKLNNGLIHIKFGVTPQVGAHNPIGFEEITYTIDSSGNKQFVDYQHKSYSENK